ncbi:MAG: NADH-quinone oxidoreductase subunit C [Candidatus Pacebacteria bacterium]|nr:NADH-quinone oxidoreductase subunit C [Candidatus Paceibacterota bacterium]
MIKEKIQKYNLPKNAELSFSENAVSFEVPSSQIEELIIDFYKNHSLSLKLVTATDERQENGCFKIWYIFGSPKDHLFIMPFIKLTNTAEFPSLSLSSSTHKIADYERRIQTFFGLKPVGHRNARQIILHENWPKNIFPLRKDFNFSTRPPIAKNNTYHFQKVKGEGIYEIPVGPIHAGIIEPGHFRFSVAGESIVLLEPRLGYTHKGSEKLFEVLPLPEKIRLSEKISGDSSFSHSLVFCQALEQLSNVKVPKRALYIRVIFSELERLANHFGDLGAIMLDTGFNFGGAQGARLREGIMQINERITGSRFLRGVNMLGGVSKDISGEEKNVLIKNLENIKKDFSEVMDIALNDASLLNRLERTGAIDQEIAKDHGVVGVVRRSLGIANDARIDYPYAGYDELILDEIAVENGGDVYARFRVRIKEVYSSIKIIQNALSKLPKGDINISNPDIAFKKDAFAVSIVEGWRGDIVYFVRTDSKGNISRVFPRDPSLINWAVLRDAGYDNVVPDFPLINKSFNLSYSGNDL